MKDASEDGPAIEALAKAAAKRAAGKKRPAPKAAPMACVKPDVAGDDPPPMAKAKAAPPAAPMSPPGDLPPLPPPPGEADVVVAGAGAAEGHVGGDIEMPDFAYADRILGQYVTVIPGRARWGLELPSTFEGEV